MRNHLIILINAGTLAAAVCRHLERENERPRIVLVPNIPPPTTQEVFRQLTFQAVDVSMQFEKFNIVAATANQCSPFHAASKPFYKPFVRRQRKGR